MGTATLRQWVAATDATPRDYAAAAAGGNIKSAHYALKAANLSFRLCPAQIIEHSFGLLARAKHCADLALHLVHAGNRLRGDVAVAGQQGRNHVERAPKGQKQARHPLGFLAIPNAQERIPSTSRNRMRPRI